MMTSLLPFLTFMFIGLAIVLAGRWLTAAGRSRRVSGEESRDPKLVFGPLTPALAAVLPAGKKQSTAVARELKQAGYYHPLETRRNPHRQDAIRNL